MSFICDSPNQRINEGLLKIIARIANTADQHIVMVATDGNEKHLAISPKESARGSSVNGGELLLAALATCACNDLFREARKRGMTLADVEVTVEAVFGAEGDAAENIRYNVRVSGDADPAALHELVHATDRVTEIQNTVRAATAVTLARVDVETTSAMRM